ncbi:MAG TPA: YceI family protein [Methylomirabilota bacterium]|nr:YceI family protein [Methylomirabilota bacterium]
MPRTKFIVDDPMTRNGVLVSSRAPLETILVRTNHVTGEIELDPKAVTDNPRVTFEVPIESLDTGIPLMNDVMRGDRWLDAAKQPAIRFTLGRVTSPAGTAALEEGKTLKVEGEGTLELRGVSRTVPVRAEVTLLGKNESTARRLPGEVLHVVARFELPLAAFAIDSHLAPQSLDKVAGTLQVEADLFASTDRPQVPEDMRQRLAAARKSLGQRLVGS